MALLQLGTDVLRKETIRQTEKAVKGVSSKWRVGVKTWMLCIDCVFRISRGMSRQQYGIVFGIISTPLQLATKRKEALSAECNLLRPWR